MVDQSTEIQDMPAGRSYVHVGYERNFSRIDLSNKKWYRDERVDKAELGFVESLVNVKGYPELDLVGSCLYEFWKLSILIPENQRCRAQTAVLFGKQIP